MIKDNEVLQMNTKPEFCTITPGYDLLHLLEQLKINGYKMTSQRRQVVQVFVENQDRFLCVEDLYGIVKGVNSGVNLTTIYRNVEALEAIGVLHKTLFDNQIAYYKLTCQKHHHHHMICTQCGKMTLLEFCPLESLKRLAKQEDFVIEGHKLEVFGRCRACVGKK